MKIEPIITKTKFRLMLIFSLLFAIFSATFDAYDETSISINETLSIDPQNWELAITCVLSISFLIIFSGLLLFKEWARKLYIYTFFPILLIYLLPSYYWTLMSGLSTIFYELGNILSTLVWGILVVPSLYQPLFKKDAEFTEVKDDKK
ncbi:hypothetical protein AC056_17885 [Acinetobacter genomosp. 33YU]|uniref:hypothetical protein n=1 Tax=Acinetobacter genomosp. 33YU TaxID=1675530 RepID=UPI0009CE3A51|nr:hypothetical protein [Acinetobacter genomosp. 33YU]ONN47940.1 hypothetical protein AC056_17885 [Acinetobacter genomosp. 33YU]